MSPRELFYSKEMPILVEQGPYTFREVEKKVRQPEQGTTFGDGRPSPEYSKLKLAVSYKKLAVNI